MIGWREWLTLPDLKIPAIKVKVDTGARTSVLHTHTYDIRERDGREFIHFQLHPLRQAGNILLQCEAEVIDYREVIDSGGHKERRPFIRTLAKIDHYCWPIEISLTNRENMNFRMLLGRTAVSGQFLVDASASYLLGTDISEIYGC